MTYHLQNNGLGDANGTYVAFGRGDADFTASGLNGTAAESAKALAKILAMVKAVPGISGADAAWQAGGKIKVSFRAAAGTPVSATGEVIKRNAAGVGAQIRAGVTVICIRTGFVPSDIVRDAPAATPAATPALTDGGGPTPPGYQAPPSAPSSMPIWPFAVGGSVLVLGIAAFFLLRKKKPAAQLTVKAA